MSLLILLVGLPVYLGLAWYLTSLIGRPNVLLEILIYVGLGVLWALPFKAVFKGVGQAPPDDER
ncbi:DUF2842 domain-containing protein [Pseudoruegeria sp. HB172150]|uniref:DUF2842 domain-containing protein n=1 Tax=Pseudoruegeria sp. HB172150 TaxID=2721164 RepID=UPI00352D53C5